ncbi:divalent cation tolerance protein CutA [Nonomuraea pusilla]|uniref:divalent cation tolerance protein CutA n=1 Tax=Nonomuraea pusilla TaxID=46177 RepID=UPI003321F36E
MGQAGTGAEHVEVRVTAGSRDEADRLAAHVRRLHSYDVPEIAAVPLTAGTDAYLHWIREETSPPNGWEEARSTTA